MILDPSGNEVKSERYAPCPRCGASADKRFPSGGFGQPWLVCTCGYEFKGLLCQPVTA